jgi:hypothetical protein
MRKRDPGGGGPRTADLPGSLGDGMIGTDPDPDLTAASPGPEGTGDPATPS